MDWKLLGALTLLLVFLHFLQESEAWTGTICTKRRVEYWTERYCCCYFLWWCSHYCHRLRERVYIDYGCCPGWTTSTYQRCDIPICNPSCEPRGTCIAPGRCRCNHGYTGEYTACTTMQCSHLLPCYPGHCILPNGCGCDSGFNGAGQQACLTITKDKGMPDIGLSTVTLSHVRRTDKTTKFSFIMDGSTEHNDLFWINQNDFNYILFEFDALYEPPLLSHRPIYVHSSELGVVGSDIYVNISKISRSGSPIRDVAFTRRYQCPGISNANPNKDIVKCTITESQFYTLLENGDWLAVEFTAKSGGYRNLINLNNPSTIWQTQYYLGQTDTKRIVFKFDFEVPKHCSEKTSAVGCRPADVPLRIENEFTKSPIKMSWGGWADDMSGMMFYHMDIFKLSQNAYSNLVEKTPLNPIYSEDVNHTHNNIYYYTNTPRESGMYSVLLQATDMANNSKIARRLVLYDPFSNISLNEEDSSKLFVSSAVPETGYMWQTSRNGTNTEIIVEWMNHFANKFISDGKLLNKVEDYPIQFKDIELDGILRSQKYVYPGLDDNEGERTIEEKPNKNGVIRFEVNTVFTDDISEPTDGWIGINGLIERYTISPNIKDGRTVRFWVRAYDVLGNTKTDSTVVHFDSTPPRLSKDPASFIRNQNGTYNRTSRILFQADDPDSGVHKIGFRLIRSDTAQFMYGSHTQAYRKNISCSDDLECICIINNCFIRDQILELDNCWFMMAKEDLGRVNVTVEVTVYNQAMLQAKFNVTVNKVDGLHGLEQYSGPMNIRVTENNGKGVRLEWDLPETESCYGRTDIVIILYMQDGSAKVYTVSRHTRFVDITGLDASQSYRVSFSLGYEGQRFGNLPFNFRTAEEDKSAVIGAIVGGVVAAVTILGLVIALVVLIRKGKLEPVRERLRPLTVRIRKTIRGRQNNTYGKSVADELYIYGGMTFDERQSWQINRNEVTLESLIKSAHFADIYKATLNYGTSKQTNVVAKCLKEGFTEKDKEMMMAKINFTGTKIGNHSNVLRFIGAVTDNEAMGPFMIYEHCENGPLKDYLESQRNNVTMELQENLFRFGLSICRGMEYLASRNIVHRRLAARNILLTFLNEVKIYGFGPQNFEMDDGDGESGKKERIPIKWMAPECMNSTAGATEKSDVWSYGVVVWEIFSLGHTPFPSIKSRDLHSRLRRGERLPKPEQCDDTWYSVMQRTWNISPDQRPTFTEMKDDLEQLFVQPAGDDYYYYKR